MPSGATGQSLQTYSLHDSNPAPHLSVYLSRLWTFAKQGYSELRCYPLLHLQHVGAGKAKLLRAGPAIFLYLFTYLGLLLQVLDASKADMLRGEVLGSNAHQHAACDSSASHTPGLAGMTGPAAASQLPLHESLEALPNQAMPEALPDQAMPAAEEEASDKGDMPEQAAPHAAAQHSESQATALTHGKKRKADKECVRAAAVTAAAVECEEAEKEIDSASHAADESNQATRTKESGSKKAHQGTLQAAFAKAKVLGWSHVAAFVD